MHIPAQKSKTTRQPVSVKAPVLFQGHSRQNHAVNLILHLQHTTGNQVVQLMINDSVIQRSELSEELQKVWEQEGKEAFFKRLSSLQVSDTDVGTFVEQTLKGADLRRARRILGTDQPLTDSQRNALFTQLVSRLGSAETFYSTACQQVNAAIQADQAAQVELIVGLVTIAITYVVPGLGKAITSLVNNIPASSSTGIHAVALGIQDRAGAIASALGETGKRAAPPVVRGVLANSPKDFFNALIQGFAASKDQIVSYITANIQNRNTLPDEDLWVYVSNWDPAERTIAGYAERIRNLYDRWQVQIKPIGPLQEGRRSTLEQDRPYSTQIGVVWVRHTSGEVLVQAVVSDGKLSFSRFIDTDLKDMALARATKTQPRGIQSIPWGPPNIFDMPASVPGNAARR